MGCAKCGAKSVRPTVPTLTVSIGTNDMRTALVYFSRHVKIQIDETVREFYPAEIINLNFSLIKAILEQDPDCLSFRNLNEKALYNA